MQLPRDVYTLPQQGLASSNAVFKDQRQAGEHIYWLQKVLHEF